MDLAPADQPVASGRRESKRRETLRPIRRCAILLTHEHGLDGWTMDDLADAAEVSRRTLFNYVPGKVDAIVGPEPEMDATVRATFVAGGPTGRLVDDLAAVVRTALEGEDIDPAMIEIGRAVFLRTPRLAVIIHERFERLLEAAAEDVVAREGADFDVARARLLLGLLLALVDAALQRAQLPSETGTVAELFVEALADARRLLA